MNTISNYVRALILPAAAMALVAWGSSALCQPSDANQPPAPVTVAKAPADRTPLAVEAQLTAASTTLKDIASQLESIRVELAKPRTASVGEYVQIVALALTLIAAFLSAWWSSRTAFFLAKDRSREEKRQFCFDLQSQFDSPQMFQCRFRAWKKLEQGDFGGITKVSELLASPHWTYEVSTVIHFFESLNRYCDEGLVDPDLAAKLFGRSYELWFQPFLSRLEIDAAAEPSRDWYEGIKAFHAHVVRVHPKRLAPLHNATPVPETAARQGACGDPPRAASSTH